MATKRIDIVKAADGWQAKSGGQPLMTAGRKDELVRQVAATARASGEATSVRIHGMNGRIQEERTYGKGADPRRSRG
jgi:Uncharacterized protein conserved in bacteria (DUF2188)